MEDLTRITYDPHVMGGKPDDRGFDASEQLR